MASPSDTYIRDARATLARLSRLTARSLGVPVVLVVPTPRVPVDPVAHGLEDVPNLSPFVDRVRSAGVAFVVPDATEDAQLAEHPLVSGANGRTAYRRWGGGVIRHDDATPLGVLVWLDVDPRPASSAELQTASDAAHVFARELHRVRLRAEEQDHAARSRRETDRLAAYIQNSPLAVVEFGPDHRILHWSSRAEALFGWDAASVIGKTAQEINLVHPDDLGYVSEVVQAWRRKGRRKGRRGIVVRNRNLTRDGEVRYCRWYNSRLDDEDGQRTFSLVEDVTEQVRYEQQLVDARREAEEANRLKSAFLANMSHEIRTPLSSIIGFADVIQEKADGELKQHATVIQSGGMRLMNTLNSVIDLARLSSRSVELSATEVDVRDEVDAAADLTAGPPHDRRTDVRVHLPDAPVRAEVDVGAFGRILNNLLSNALKFSDDGPVTLGLRTTRRGFAVRVEDTGVGIAPEFQAHLFKEFRQEDTGIRRRHEGSGLGLAITRHLVDLHGGRIQVGSTKDVGTVFTVFFPRTLPQPDPQPVQSPVNG